MLTSAAPQVPQALIDQLKPAGKLVTPVEDSPGLKTSSSSTKIQPDEPNGAP